MIYTPYSALVTPAQLAPTAANFPCLRAFFPCTETSGATLTDTIGGVTLACAGLSNSNAFSVRTTTGTPQAMIGSLPAPGTTPFIVFAVGEFDTGNFRLGDSTLPTVRLTAASPTVQNSLGLESANGTAFALTTASTVYGRAMVISAYNTASTGQRTYEAPLTAVPTALTATPTDATNASVLPLPSMGSMSTAWTMASGKNLYGIALFTFTVMPAAASLQSAFAWMTKQWSIGNKAIYPAWKGIS